MTPPRPRPASTLTVALLAALPGCATPDPGDPGDPADPAPFTDPAPGPTCGGFDWPLDVPANVLGARIVAGRADAETLAAIDTLVPALAALAGPWIHAVEGPWRSADGVAWARAEGGSVALASVPDVVVDDDGRLWMFHVDGDLAGMAADAAAGAPMSAGWRGIGGLVAKVSDDGLTWEDAPLTLAAAHAPLYLADPDVLRLPDGRWRLYALHVAAEDGCADNVDPSLAAGSIWAAESDDLVHWTEVGPVWDAAEGATDPAVWCPGAEACYAAVTFRSANLGFAASGDGGLTFADTALDFPTPRVAMPDVLPIGGAWWMVAQGDRDELVRFASADGATWEAANTLAALGLGPTAVARNGVVEVWAAVEPD